MEKEIRKTWFFSHEPQKVWDYLTKPELMEQWLMKSDFKPVVGHRFRFTFESKPGGTYEGGVQCEVLEVMPCSRLSYSWNGATKDKSREYKSAVVWTLVPKDNGTELRLQHSGFEVLDDVLAHSNGWDGCLKKLESHMTPVTI